MTTHALGGDVSHGLRIFLLTIRLVAYFLTLVGLSVFTWRLFGSASLWRKLLTAALLVSAQRPSSQRPPGTSKFRTRWEA
jgi:hypothetical protein